MSTVRKPFDELEAKLLKTILGTKEQIIKAVREGSYSVEEARSLADFLIRARKHKDIDLDDAIIDNFLSDICDASNDFTLQSELIPALNYYRFHYLDQVDNFPSLLFFDLLDKPTIPVSTMAFSAYKTCIHMHDNGGSFDIIVAFVFNNPSFSKAESEVFLKKLTTLHQAKSTNTYESKNLSLSYRIPYQYILNEGQLSDKKVDGILDCYAQLDFKGMARTAYEHVIKQRSAASPLVAHSLLKPELPNVVSEASATPTAATLK